MKPQQTSADRLSPLVWPWLLATLLACTSSPAAAPGTWVDDGAAQSLDASLGDAAGADSQTFDAALLGDADPDAAWSATDAPALPDASAPGDVGLQDAAATGDVGQAADAGQATDAGGAPDTPAGTDAAAPDGGDSGGADVPYVQPPLWDTTLIEDAADAKCTFTGKHTAIKDGVLLDAWHLTYVSYESIGGVLKPILIQAFAARPQGGGVRPGIVQAHGLGGFAKEEHATGIAALTGAFAVAYTGPGGGTEPNNTSQGLASGANNGMRMFDVFPDTRGSWFWGHAMAARRALTCVAHHPDVDATRLGITGFSAGGVISFLVGGSDARIKAAVPLSGVLAWDVATASPNAWQHVLLKKAGLTVASPAWKKLMAELITPAVALAASSAKLFLVNGSSDEFFPLTASAATWGAWKGPRWLSLVGNFDHGVFAAFGSALPGGTKKIEADADLRARGAQRALFHHVFGTDTRYAQLPQPPSAQLQVQGALIVALAVPKPAPAALQLDAVHLWWTLDNGKTWLTTPLDKNSGVWTKQLPGPPPANLVWYVDAVYRTKDLIPQWMSVSTEPVIPAGWVPDIWAMP